MRNFPSLSYTTISCLLLSTTLPFTVSGLSAPPVPSTRTCHFGAGCFWAPSDKLRDAHPGILSSTVGYCGDDSFSGERTPDYQTVCAGRTRLVEAVRVEYDETRISYEDVLGLFQTANTAEPRNSRQYQGVIFTNTREEFETASAFLEGRPSVVAKVEPMSEAFYKAEKYHQDYWAKWRLRFPLFLLLLAGESSGIDAVEKVSLWGFYGGIALALLERRIDTDVEKIIV